MSNLPAPVDNFDYRFGFEDYESDNEIIPEIKIDSEQKKLRFDLSGVLVDSVNAVILGSVDERVLWSPQMGETKGPLCKSNDAKVGKPDPGTFPWKASGFQLKAYDEDTGLPCADCQLRKKGTHPSRNKPWCDLHHRLIILTKDEEDNYNPHLLVAKGSSVWPLDRYRKGIESTRRAMFQYHTMITLDHRTQGSVRYSVLQFAMGEPTDPAYYQEWQETFLLSRQQLLTRFAAVEDDGDGAATGSRSAAAMDDTELAWDKD